ncbi:hypothetical protein FRC00_007211, partial [Tulasnella sp. 408]
MLFSKASLLAVVGIATAIPYVSAFGNHLFRKREPFEPRQTSTAATDYSTEYWFDQLLDHANPSAGTFKQRYFFSDQYYKGQGSPIVIGTPGEQSADGFHTDLTGQSMMNSMMQLWGAAGVVLEHRYWGKSSPYPQLTAPNLQYLTVQQAIDDYKGTSLFYQFCDAIETNADGTQNLSPQGVGMPQAFENWASVIKALGPDANCPGTGGACYSSADPNSAMYADTSVSDTYMRAWVWLLCTELGWFQVGDMGNSSTIISSQLTPAYFQRQCAYYFPLADGTHSTYDFSQAVTEFNTQFKGWNVVGNNLFVVNGEFDPWRSASLSSKWAPQFVDTPTQEIVVVPNGHHCWDFYVANGQVDGNVKSIQQQGVAEITGWLRNWYNAHPGVTNHMDATASTVADAGPDNASTDDLDDEPDDDGPDNNIAGDAGADDAADELQTNGNDNNSNNNDDASDLKSKIDELASNKKLAMISFIINGVLALL